MPVRGSATLTAPGGLAFTLDAGQSRQVSQTAQSQTASHALRNHLITAAVVGTPIAAIAVYRLTHQVQTITPCSNCITSPSQ